MSLDGKIACHSGESKWISSPAARRYAHQLRAWSEAVIVGSGTVLQDDPALSVRRVKPLSPLRPLRVILEGRRTLPGEARLIHTAAQQPVLIATARRGRHPLAGRKGVEIESLPAGESKQVDIRALLQRLAGKGCSLVLVEGGAETQAAFLGLGENPGPVLADQVQFIVAPLLLGGRTAPGPVGGRGAGRPAEGVRLQHMTWTPLGPDMLVTATLRPPKT